MILYNIQRYGVLSVVKLRGSVFPKAVTWAISNAILAWALHRYTRTDAAGAHWDMTGVNVLWGSYTAVLGFLIVFRNNQAYTRFWEGATLINQLRGEWFNAVSTLFTFCNHTQESQPAVERFQGTLIRLMSLLHSSALQQVCELQDDRLEILENEGMDGESLRFLQQDSNDRCEILMQWVQRLIVDSDESKVLKVAPPLLTRAFQELSRGIVNLNNARKIKEIPFPFPYAQMITMMLIVQWMMNPLLASQVIDSAVAASATCFFVTFGYWCLIYIALEIDQPFGEDANDLPLREMQRDFNRSLLSLMHPLAQKVPAYRSLEHPSIMRGNSMWVHTSQEPGFVEKSPPLIPGTEPPKKGHSTVSLKVFNVFRKEAEDGPPVDTQRSWTLGCHTRVEVPDDGTTSASEAENGAVPAEPSVRLAPVESAATSAKSTLRHYQGVQEGPTGHSPSSPSLSSSGPRHPHHARASESSTGRTGIAPPSMLGRETEGPPMDKTSMEDVRLGLGSSKGAGAASGEHGTAVSTRESTLENPATSSLA